MKMEGFVYEGTEWNEQKLKEVGKNYVQIFKGNWKISEDEIREPFIIVNCNPSTWCNLSRYMYQISEDTGIYECGIAGPYSHECIMLTNNLGKESYVYMNYDIDDDFDMNEGVDFRNIGQNMIHISELASYLQTGTSPSNRLPINGLSPTQYFMVLQYCIQQFGETVDITKNELELAPFIFRPNFNTQLKLNSSLDYSDDQLIEICASQTSEFIQSLSEVLTTKKIVCCYFRPE